MSVGVLCLFCNISAYAQDIELAEGQIIVKNREEFYKALSEQILEHKDQVIYYTNVGALGADIEEVYRGYAYFHDIENPLASGTYMSKYVKRYELYWQEGNFPEKTNLKIEVNLKFKYGKVEVDTYFSQMHELATQLKKDTTYDSVKAVHDYIVKNYEYDDSLTNYLDYEGYQTGLMVCQGYCMAAFYLLSDMGIPVRFVSGASVDYQADANHAWNVVYVDGNWYNMDVTWDDKGEGRPVSYQFFLKSDADFYSHTREGRYDYDGEMALVSYPMKNRTQTVVVTVVIVVIIVLIVVRLFLLGKRDEN